MSYFPSDLNLVVVAFLVYRFNLEYLYLISSLHVREDAIVMPMKAGPSGFISSPVSLALSNVHLTSVSQNALSRERGRGHRKSLGGAPTLGSYAPGWDGEAPEEVSIFPGLPSKQLKYHQVLLSPGYRLTALP